MIRTTYTFAELEISTAAYDEIAAKLRKADYSHAINDDGTLDMTGIGLTRQEPPSVFRWIRQRFWRCPRGYHDSQSGRICRCCGDIFA